MTPTMLRAAALALAVMATAPAGNALAQDEELCGMIAGAICNGGDLAPCFQSTANWEYVPPICTGFVQTLIEMEREAMQQSPANRASGGGGGWGGAPAQASAGDAMATGVSFGGVLRDGPGMEFARAGSLQNGDWLDLLEPTGVWMEGYQWYLVNSHAGQGFHWGGIFCTDQNQLDGVFQAC